MRASQSVPVDRIQLPPRMRVSINQRTLRERFSLLTAGTWRHAPHCCNEHGIRRSGFGHLRVRPSRQHQPRHSGPSTTNTAVGARKDTLKDYATIHPRDCQAAGGMTASTWTVFGPQPASPRNLAVGARSVWRESRVVKDVFLGVAVQSVPV